jgi:hypothetical protein
MERVAKLSENFGITTCFPLYDEFDTEDTARHFLEDTGLPSTGGGERKCLFCQTLTSAAETDIAGYLDYMIPVLTRYIEYRLSGQAKDAAGCFPPGNRRQKKKTDEAMSA